MHITIPWILLAEPTYLLRAIQVKKDEKLDVWMIRGIHTIEFGTGLVSNSSSYLRMRAVSLAHAQLTKVLVQFTVGLDYLFFQIVLFPIFVFATTALSVGLEGIGSCLHVLRFNWIEFIQSFIRELDTSLNHCHLNKKYDEKKTLESDQFIF